MDKKPFEELGLMMDAEDEINAYLENQEDKGLQSIVERTKQFLSGFYSSFGLELLSTIDFISQQYQSKDFDLILNKLTEWSDRKKTIFSNQNFVQLAINQLNKYHL